MKKIIPLILIGAIISPSCSHKYYTSTFFKQQTANHKLIAVLPSEIIFTGKQPKDITPEQISKIEEEESVTFQQSLYGDILRYANSRKYYMFVGVQEIKTTLDILEKNNISIKDSWKTDDKKLTEILGVDAIVRMQIRQRRYMSDYTSYGISVVRGILGQTTVGNEFPIPRRLGRTEDIYANCSVVSNDITLWNNNYKSSADWDNPSNVIIENITDNFGRNSPYKKRR